MNKIRITGGNLKGRTIDVAEGKDARYTSSKVREALFNIIGDVEGKNILDLFAGAGSFSIEALSRGAARQRLWRMTPEGRISSRITLKPCR